MPARPGNNAQSWQEIREARRQLINEHITQARRGRPGPTANWRDHPYYIRKLGEEVQRNLHGEFVNSSGEEIDEGLVLTIEDNDGDERNVLPIGGIYFDTLLNRYDAQQNPDNGHWVVHNFVSMYGRRIEMKNVTNDFNSPEQQRRANQKIDREDEERAEEEHYDPRLMADDE
jgi:hypothetical protein